MSFQKTFTGWFYKTEELNKVEEQLKGLCRKLDDRLFKLDDQLDSKIADEIIELNTKIDEIKDNIPVLEYELQELRTLLELSPTNSSIVIFSQ